MMIWVISCTNTQSEFSDSYAFDGKEKETGISAIIESVTLPDPLEAKEYVKWVEDPAHGLLKKRSLDRYRYSLLYKPGDYMIIKDIDAASIKVYEYDSLRKVYEGLEYYTFSIEDTTMQDELLKSQLGSREEYEQRILYYSFEMQKDIQLISGKDTLPCSLLHFERTYNISPKANFLLGFPVNKNSSKEPESKTLVYEDRVFKTGIVKLRIEGDALKKIPGIKLVK